ncbi:hypothetical protein BC938DRAFT_481634 [Jimgerdemannia flammicorona]|uniref:Uncharacterized protein n=1 Tax=Jimgerdemannia flammicorona TaxID=994334 RepID=A0A433QFS8_9FUNG|nr:hypothetical protein BC938DRAFT_481634 [Jimgerdemannia flammicorona]
MPSLLQSKPTHLVFQSRILSLGVFADDSEVDTVMAGRVSGDIFNERDGGVHVEVFAHDDVE